MPESKSWENVPLAPANKAPPAPLFPWSGRFRAAMFLSFDVDAESAWTSKDPAHAERLVTMSFGGYEARVGTPKLLELLRDLGLKATFFVTGWSVEAHPSMAEAILKEGHEIGHHGFHHLLPDPGDPFIQEELRAGLRYLEAAARPRSGRLSGTLRRELRGVAREPQAARHALFLLMARRCAALSPGACRRQRRRDRAPGDLELRRLDARLERALLAALDLSARARPLDVEGRARRGARLGRHGDHRAASAGERASDALSPPA